MNNKLFIFLKIMFVSYVVVGIRVENKQVKSQLSYSISRNSVNYADGVLRIIARDEKYLYIGGKSVVLQIPFNFLSKIRLFLTWTNTKIYYCDKGTDMYVQYMQEPSTMNALIEVCGSSGCQQVCRSYDTKNGLFINRHNGFEMVPIDISFSTRHIVRGSDIIVAVPSDGYQDGVIAQHFNRSFAHGRNNPMIISQFGSVSNYVDFLQLFSFKDKTYFVFTEFPSEMANFYHTFRKSQRPKMLYTRLGRICANDKGIQSSKLFFTSFIKATLFCRRTLETTGFRKEFVDYTHAIGAIHSSDDQNMFTILYRSNEPIGTHIQFSYAICQYSLLSIESQLAKARLAFLTKTENTTFWSADRFKRDLSTCNTSSNIYSPKVEFMVTDLLTPVYPPLLIQSNETFGSPTSIDVLKSTSMTIITPDNNTINIIFDMIYMATDKGVITRNILINDDLKRQFSANESIQYYRRRLKIDDNILRFDHYLKVFEENSKIKSLVINKYSESIIVVGDSFVRRLPLGFCATNCWSCNNNIDPFCQWNPWTKICEVKSLKGWNGIIRIYDCDSGRMEKSLKPVKEVQYDSFWLIFSFIMFFTIFSLVLTVSIVLKYTSGNPSIFQSLRRAKNSRFYQTVRNKNVKESKDQITCPFNAEGSLFTMTLEKSNISKQNKSSKSDSESVVIENKKTYTTSQKHNPKRICLSEFRHFYGAQIASVNIQTNSVLTGWKSCDAVLDLLREHQSLDNYGQICK